MNRVGSCVCLFLMMTLACSMPIAAQTSLGMINGIVRDPSGAAIPKATIVATNIKTGVSITTSATDTGDYRFLNLLVGEYAVTASQPGFQTVRKINLQVVLGETLTVDIDLPISRSQETVTVRGDAAVDTTSTTTGTTIVSQEIDDVPIQLSGTNRNIRDYISVLPGVKSRNGATDVNNHAQLAGVGDGGGSRSVAGYRVDGLFAGGSFDQALGEGRAQIPIPEQVEEMRVVTNENAEYGGDGGAAMEVILKSGTNHFHGSGFEIMRNEALDAANFLAKRASFDREHEFGGAIGGPIIKNKHFFFFTVDQYLRQFAQAGAIESFPTAKMRAGDFSEWLGPQIGTDSLGRPVFRGEIYDPSTTRPDGKGGFIRDPFSYNGQLNVINPTRLSPISQFLQKYYPLPTQSGTQNNWVGTLENQNTPRFGVNVKTDHDFGAHRLSSFFEYTKNSAVPQGSFFAPPQINGERDLHNHSISVRLNYTWTIRPNFLFTAGAAVNKGKAIVAVPDAASNIGQQAGIVGTQTQQTPNVTLGGIAQNIGIFQPFADTRQQTTPVRLDLTWSHGNHQVKFGTDYIQGYFGLDVGSNGPGVFNFSANESKLPLSSLNTGNAYASFLLGQVDSGVVGNPTYTSYRATNWGYYAQDEWRATRKFTVNYGLRYDLFLTPSEARNRIGSFDPTIPNPAAGGLLGALTFWGDGSGRNGLHDITNTAYKNFGPRLGLAYDFGKFGVVRAYYGIQYFPLTAIGTEGRSLPSYGWSATLNPTTLDGGVTPAFDWDNGFPGSFPQLPTLNPSLLNGSSLIYYNPNEKKVGMSQDIGLSIERELPWGMSAKVAYAGKLSHNLPTDQLIGLNQIPLSDLALGSLLSANINSAAARAAGIPIPYAGFTGTVQQALRPYPQYGDIDQANAMVAEDLYHAAEITVQKRLSQGFHFLLSYTISKEIANDGLAGAGGGSGAVDIPNSSLQSQAKMLAYNIDRPQTLTLSWGYELPFGPGKPFLSSSNSILQSVVGGWRISGVQSYASGTPIRILGASAVPTAGPSWVNEVPGVPIRTSTTCANYNPNNPNAAYLNINAFSEPAPFTLGNTRVLPNIRTCGIINENLALTKGFRIGERTNVELAARAFDVLNRHSWSNFGTSINLPATFGRSTAATGPRTMQLNLIVTF